MTLAIPETAVAYLQAQRGALDDMKADKGRWLALYERALQTEFETMRPYLPADCVSILDVGGGMSGISIFLNRHFGGDCEITILDGIADPPFVGRHAKTFSHFSTATNFLRANGVRQVFGIEASRAPSLAPRFWDLIISQKSWCFHYPPSRYMSIVKSGCIAGVTRLILDTRNDKPEWNAELLGNFRFHATAFAGLKHNTKVFDYEPT